MTAVYLPPSDDLKQVKAISAALEAAGYSTDEVRLGVAWEEFLATVPDHTTIVVYSVDFFSSLMELLGALAQLHERGMLLYSLQEPWLSAPTSDTASLLVGLRQLAFTLHASQTRRGLAKARTAGRTFGRPRKTTV